MKKFLLSAFLILTFGFYVFYQRFGGSDESSVVTPKSITTNTQPGLPSQNTSNVFKDGQYTGDITDAYYGNVQVKANISGGKISDVQFLQYPNDRRTSVSINSQAMPYLKQEAIQSQNANVDIVSGATQTSRAFRQSLQSALDKAS